MLAQYRELQSFSQFGSDIDADTKRRLDHGSRIMEILKQGQYGPLDVAYQVMIIYAAINGMLDDVPVNQIRAFEIQFYPYMDDHFPEIRRNIDETGDLSKETEELLIKGINEFKKVGFVNG